ncbi:MAG: aldo/keto reductase [Desulfobacter sp.]|nr:MAG: aldo/keto reductase [Desulfobacter sp.]
MGLDFSTAVLGRTGLNVGRLGLAGSYGAPARAYEAAFDRGCNYFYSGSGRKRSQMKLAIRHLAEQGQRDKMVVAVQTYARMGLMTEFFFRQALKSMALEYADILMLGWHNRPPSEGLMDLALSMKEKGLVRFIGMSGHNRRLFSRLARDSRFDLFQIRYNPAHRGAETDCFPALEAACGDNPENGYDHPGRPGLVTYTATRWGHLLKDKYMPKGEPPLQASDCYRFSLSRPQVDVCLCGPKDEAQMAHALTALEKGRLSPEETKRIIRIGDHVHATAKGFFN